MLRVAVPNKGALSEAAITMLTEAGYRQRSDSKELVLTDAANHVDRAVALALDTARATGATGIALPERTIGEGFWTALDRLEAWF